MTLSARDIKEFVNEGLDEIVDNCSLDTDREELIELLDELNDDTWTGLTHSRNLSLYTVDDVVAYASDWAAIIKCAQECSWVESDSGLWEGYTYGVVAAIAYYSLRNCFYQLLKDRGIDTNDDFPMRRA